MNPAARRGILLAIIGAAVLLGALVFDYWWLGGTGGAAPVAIGGPFTLIDQTGTLRHDSDFRGKLMLVYFGYTYCPDACPTALQDMTQALDDLGDKQTEVEPIFITVDPARDTAAQMKLYAENFHPRLIALTGTPAQIAAAAREYRVYYQKVEQGGPADYLMDHSSFIYLMDRDGHFLAHFGPGVKPEQMAAEIKRFL
jgi:protein SCO1/2